MPDMRRGERRAFEVTRAHVAAYPPGTSFGPRRMTDWEFVWIIEGDCRYRRDERWCDAPEGSIVLCTIGTNDGFEWDRHRTTRHGCFHFTRPPDGVATPAEGWPVVVTPGDGDVLRPLFRHVLSHWPGGDGRVREEAVRLMLLAFALGEADAAGTPEPDLPAPVRRALSLVYERLDGRRPAVAFDEMVAAAGVTGAHLCRLFRRHVGHTPAEAARLARLDRAADLLVKTDLSVGRIADGLGFATPFHLSRVFARAFGMPPTELRRRVASGEVPPLPRMHHWPGRGRKINAGHATANAGDGRAAGGA